jgi:hypothetical protein
VAEAPTAAANAMAAPSATGPASDAPAPARADTAPRATATSRERTAAAPAPAATSAERPATATAAKAPATAPAAPATAPAADVATVASAPESSPSAPAEELGPSAADTVEAGTPAEAPEAPRRDRIGELLASLTDSAAETEQQTAIQQVLSEIDCGHVRANRARDTGTLVLDGFVADAAARTALRERLRQAANGLAIRDESLAEVPPPLCQRLAAVARSGAAPGEQAGRARTYTDGQRITFSLSTPDYPSHVYVDYYDRGGQVHHLMPSQYRLRNRFPPDHKVTIGSGDGMELRVTPPYGTELVVVMSASAKLFAERRPLSEPAARYIDDVAAAIRDLSRRPGGQVHYSYLVIEVSPDRSNLAKTKQGE